MKIKGKEHLTESTVLFLCYFLMNRFKITFVMLKK